MKIRRWRGLSTAVYSSCQPENFKFCIVYEQRAGNDGHYQKGKAD